MLFIAKSY